jgi:hypothetical protein
MEEHKLQMPGIKELRILYEPKEEEAGEQLLILHSNEVTFHLCNCTDN